MASHKSAIKRIRQTERRTAVNRATSSRLKTQVKKLAQAIESKDAKTAEELLRPTVSVVDRSVQKGVLTRNKAARMKSRLTPKVRALAAQS